MLASNIITLGIAAEHTYIMILEMFLWPKPIGRRTFKQSIKDAATTAPLAKNMGLYNGFLAGALLLSTLYQPGQPSQLYSLGCVVVAGIYGGFTVRPRIFFVQAVPAILALTLKRMGM